jgi:hypothetical protein
MHVDRPALYLKSMTGGGDQKTPFLTALWGVDVQVEI